MTSEENIFDLFLKSCRQRSLLLRENSSEETKRDRECVLACAYARKCVCVCASMCVRESVRVFGARGERERERF